MNIVSALKYHGLKTMRMAWYHVRYRVSKWKKVQDIFIPVRLNYGYSVLRFIDNGEYEQHEVILIKKHLSEDDKVLELGTGIGFISACCAKIAGNENVYTFEGNPQMEPLIKELYTKNNVHPHAAIAMLGEKEGEKKFYVNDESFLASSNTLSEKGAERIVPERNLNEVIASIRPSYLVMDIEGGEYDIFRIIDFQTINKVQFELHPRVLSAAQAQSIFDRLKAENFIRDADKSGPDNYFFSR